jgi:hypothetical protein
MKDDFSGQVPDKDADKSGESNPRPADERFRSLIEGAEVEKALLGLRAAEKRSHKQRRRRFNNQLLVRALTIVVFIQVLGLLVVCVWLLVRPAP